MEYITTEVINLLRFLLPGFLTSFIIFSLTSFPKKNEFESIVIALIFTLVIQPLVYVVEQLLIFIGNFFRIGEWNTISEIFFSMLFALIIGLLFSYLLNTDKLFKILRDKKITIQTSYPSEWFGVFSETKKDVVLHLKDERRIYGWPYEWPSYPNNGHFVLQNAEWLLEDNTSIKLENVDKIVIDSTMVEMVEFVELEKEVENEPKSTAATK